MAFKLTGVVGVDMTPETMDIELAGEDIQLAVLPLTPQMERAARDRAKVRADSDGFMIVSDVDKLQRELAVEVIDAWTIVNEKDKTANINVAVVGWLMDFSADAATFVRDVIGRARELYEERRKVLDKDDPEGN